MSHHLYLCVSVPLLILLTNKNEAPPPLLLFHLSPILTTHGIFNDRHEAECQWE